MAGVLCFNTAPVTSEVVDRPCQPLHRDRHKKRLFIYRAFQSQLKMAFRVVRQRREARKNAKIEEIFQVEE